MMSEIKNLWAEAKLENLCSITTGDKDVNEGAEKGAYPFFTCAQAISRSNTYSFDGDALLIAGNGNFNVKKHSGKFEAYQRTYVLSDFQILFEYLFYFIYSNLSKITKDHRGSTIRYIRIGDLSNYSVPFPSASEQRRIVIKIEELLSELDNGVENLRSAQQQLKVYRQALINDVLKAKNHSDSLTVPLSDLIGRINQGWSPKCELNRQAVDGEWAIIKTTAVQSMQYSQEECKPLPENFDPRPEIEIKVGDFLMTRKGPRNRTGVVCLVEATRSKSMFCDTVYRFRCDETKVYPKYLELVLNSPAVVAELDRRKSGISDSGISLNHPKLKTLPIPLVGTVAAQKNIVDEVELKLGKITTLDIEVSQSLLKAEALRQSILKKAFAGQLVPQDPADEPTSVLLERIRAERAAQPGKARERKAKA